MTDYGFITLHRKIKDSAIWSDSQAVHLWVHLLLKANHKDNQFLQNGKLVSVKRGQTVTGRRRLSDETGIAESKIQRLLRLFEDMQMIEQQTNSKNRLISITNYDMYQSGEQQVNSRRTASEQQVNTNNNDNNEDNDNNEYIEQAKLALDYLNQVTGRKFKKIEEVKARLKDYSLNEIQLVIDYKAKEWMGSDWQKYLRPETLFNKTKFEGYLNDAIQRVPTQPQNKITLGDLTMEEIARGDTSRMS